MVVLDVLLAGNLLAFGALALRVRRPKARLEDLLAAALDDHVTSGLPASHPAASHARASRAVATAAAGGHRGARSPVGDANGDGGTIITFPTMGERAQRRSRSAHPAGSALPDLQGVAAAWSRHPSMGHP